MTPKEKAEELVRKFTDVDFAKDFDGLSEDLAIECAKIAANEVYNALPERPLRVKFDKMWWKWVGQEIEKL